MGLVVSKHGERRKIGEKYRRLPRAEDGSKENEEISYKEDVFELEKEIDFSGNVPEPVFIIHRPKEIHLYLCKYGLFTLSPDIRYFRGLKILQICCNYIQELPQEIEELQELVILFMARNRLQSLPDTIGNLPNLREINISDNCLRSLPTSMRQLSSLEIIDISGNPFEELPKAIPYIGPLRSITVLRTKICYFPPEILRLVFLNMICFPETLAFRSIISRYSKKEYSAQYIQGSIVLRRISPIPLYERTSQKVISSIRKIRKNTPERILKMMYNVNSCDVCGSPLFTPFVVIFTCANICGREIPLRFQLCKNHPLDYMSPFTSLREYMFKAKEYAGDQTIPNIAFIFDLKRHNREQRKIVIREQKKLNDPAEETVHILLLEKLLEKR
ncbi:hypothetical protein NEFER03_1495 [Nematocida sp. LUAm3]|nr:hypothetical protein NEFER03_1495 [Nematocida sp. LUAm3]KAI5174528.1 hypothetical protein NEFER02_0649 [Nematocida sp. LUAm2]KAI5178066.1 hypothetical protein NEFER01_1248 [Nematocida sp. LUAm1]